MPYCVVSYDTGYIYGTGSDKKAAIQSSRGWIVEEVDMETLDWTSGSLLLPRYDVFPCTELVVEETKARGGHTDWRKVDGTVKMKEELDEDDMEDPQRCFGCGTLVDGALDATKGYTEEGQRLADVYLCSDYPECAD